MITTLSLKDDVYDKFKDICRERGLSNSSGTTIAMKKEIEYYEEVEKPTLKRINDKKYLFNKNQSVSL